jgi:hypothetical protein
MTTTVEWFVERRVDIAESRNLCPRSLMVLDPQMRAKACRSYPSTLLHPLYLKAVRLSISIHHALLIFGSSVICSSFVLCAKETG